MKPPRARSDRIVVRNLDSEVLIYDRDRNQATCLNSFAAQVWSRCDGATLPAAIAQEIAKNTADSIDERAVWLALAQLGRSQLLDEPCKVPAWVLGGGSRRALLRTLAVGAAAAVPVVTSIVVPTVADAASGLPTGAPCASHADCASGLCVAGTCT